MNAITRHWFLNLAAENPCPLDILLPTLKDVLWNVPPIPAYTSLDYALELKYLLREGLLALIGENGGVPTSGVEEAIDRAFHQPADLRNFQISLTKNGGCEWERLANPQWHRFLKYALTFMSATPSHREAELLLACRDPNILVASLGWCEELDGFEITWPTLEWSSHSSYNVTYWKQLDDVFQVTAQGVMAASDKHPPRWLHEWKRGLARWYQSPWESPDWPGESR